MPATFPDSTANTGKTCWISVYATPKKRVSRFLSGLIGIGGGIVLSPILLILGWANMKQTAAVSALFIFVNSISGIVGFLSKGSEIPTSSSLLIGIVFVGGFFGAYYGSKKFNSLVLRNVLAIVLGIAIFKLFTI